MQFPSEIESHIKQFAQPCAATLRPDWRNGSCILKHLRDDRWWIDYSRSSEYMLCFNTETTWSEWCQLNAIIGPPRWRSDSEPVVNDKYLTAEDWRRHWFPWFNTWPDHNDRSWCKVRGVPDWAKEEYLATK